MKFGLQHPNYTFVAKYSDACNLTGGTAMIRHKLEVLREHCRAVERDYDEILKIKLGHLVIARGAQEAKSIAEGEGYTPEKLNDYIIYGTPTT
jgi:hypothetical protein